MDDKLLFALFGTLLLMGTAHGQQSDPQDMSTLQKDRRISVVNELIKAQEQIHKALKKLYKSTAQPGEQDGSDEEDCSGESNEEGSHSGEEHAYLQMKQKKIQEARLHFETNMSNVLSNFLVVNGAIKAISSKVDEVVNNKKSVGHYSLYYNKQSRPPIKKHPRRSHYRSSRQLQDVEGPVAEEEKEQKELVDGNEVMPEVDSNLKT